MLEVTTGVLKYRGLQACRRGVVKLRGLQAERWRACVVQDLHRLRLRLVHRAAFQVEGVDAALVQ